LQFRLYHPDDFAQLYAIEELCFEVPFRFSRRYMRELIARSDGATWITEEDGRMAGFAVVGFNREGGTTVAYIETIEVGPTHRRQGLGAELLKLIEDSALAAAATVIWLHVDAQNDSAIRLYRAQGYERHGRKENYYARGRAAEIFAKFLQ
jgi:[ribosomal protein S18]-alanine N-acetyltransferase